MTPLSRGHAIQATTGAKMDITTFYYDDMINDPNRTLPRLYNISLCKIMVTTLHSSISSNYKPYVIKSIPSDLLICMQCLSQLLEGQCIELEWGEAIHMK